jgi:hypothetical protein
LYYTHESKGIKRRKKEIRKKPKNWTEMNVTTRILTQKKFKCYTCMHALLQCMFVVKIKPISRSSKVRLVMDDVVLRNRKIELRMNSACIISFRWRKANIPFKSCKLCMRALKLLMFVIKMKPISWSSKVPYALSWTTCYSGTEKSNSEWTPYAFSIR